MKKKKTHLFIYKHRFVQLEDLHHRCFFFFLNWTHLFLADVRTKHNNATDEVKRFIPFVSKYLPDSESSSGRKVTI